MGRRPRRGACLRAAAPPAPSPPAACRVTSRIRAAQSHPAPICRGTMMLSGAVVRDARDTGRTGSWHQRERRSKPKLRAPSCVCTPDGIRTHATAVRGRRPRPLDDGGIGGGTHNDSTAKRVRRAQLAYQDSNLERRYQKPLCCQLHHRPLHSLFCPLRSNLEETISSPRGECKSPGQLRIGALFKRAIEASLPSSSIDSKSGGDMCEPVTATRTGP